MRIGQGFENVVEWVNEHLAGTLNGIDVTLSGFIDFIYNLLENIPFGLFFIVVALIPLLKKSWKLSIFIMISLLYINSVGYWDATIQTLSIIFVGLVISLVVGIPLGILAAIYKRFDSIMKPVLDFMQTMPSFVYLLPAVTFFGTGNVAAIVAIVIYSISPVIRLTTLGIREVPTELLEASDAFGSTRKQKLIGVQIPVAKRTIMTGVNQTIMMSLSMVVIAAMIGAEGLGSIVFTAVASLNLSAAFESGLAIVFLAISLDRLTQLVNSPAVNIKPVFKKAYSLLLVITIVFSVFSSFSNNANDQEVEVINVATNDGWSDHVALGALFSYIVETETNYQFEFESLDTTYIFGSLASNDNDVYLSAWMPTSQAAYDKYEDKIEYISTPFTGAKIGIVVPSYMTDVNSIADLKGRESDFNNVFFGIEPGTQTAAIAEGVPDAYGLDMRQSTSSSAAMLQELDNAIKKEQDVVVTLWSPHWSFAKYDIKMLEDPKEAMGTGDEIIIYSRLGFAEDYPELTEMLASISLSNDQFADLMERMNGKDQAEYDQIVADFLNDNPDIYTFS